MTAGLTFEPAPFIIKIKSSHNLLISVLFYLCVFKLAGEQRVIKALDSQQFLVCSLFNNIAVFHNQNNVALLNRGQAVSDDKARSALHQLFERLLNPDFGERID